MRRLLFEEPYSAAAQWSSRLATFSAAVGVIAVVLGRLRLVDFTAVMAVLAASLLIACASLLLASTAAVVIWRTGRRGVGIICKACVVAALVLGYPTYLLAQAIRFPPISDVTTDLVDPPDFSRSGKALAARDDAVHDVISSTSTDEQRRAYPDVQPIVLDLEMDDTWRLVERALAARGWRVVDEVQPGGRMGNGHIDAVARSRIMALPIDIAVRLRPLAGQTRVDIRTATRYGRHDFGAGAALIARFSDELQKQLDAR